MIELKPNINRVSDYYRCPECGGRIFIKDFFVIGAMNLADLECRKCRGQFLAELPVLFGIQYQTIIDKKKLEIKDTAREDWALRLLNSYQNQHYEEIKIIHKIIEDKKDIILINCLNYCYGHSLWKILNSSRYIDKYGKDFGICLIIPYQLQHLIPEGVSEILEVVLPFNKYQEWFNSINEKIHNLIAQKNSCYLAVNHYTLIPQSYNISKFPILRKRVQEKKNYKSIIFLYREDQRIWGFNLWHQQRNIKQLFKYLKNYYPNLRFILIGIGKRKKFDKEIIDLREEKFDINLEKRWLEEYRMADCAIGVHGSNMNLPSILVKHMINLVPEYKYANALEDMRLDPSDSLSNNLYRYRAVYGNYFLSDISPKKIFKILVHQLDYSKRSAYLFNLNLEPSINNIDEYRKVGAFYKNFSKDLNFKNYSLITKLFDKFPFLKGFFKKIRGL